MYSRLRTLISSLKLPVLNITTQHRTLVKVRLKWAKNRSLDHVIEIETNVKAAILLKDAIKRASAGFLTSRSVSEWQKLLGLTVPVVRFMRRYTTLFEEFPHPRYHSMPCFKLTDTAKLLDSQEQSIYSSFEIKNVEKLVRLLMMTRSRTVPLQSIHTLRWDLGLPDDFVTSLVQKHPEYFRAVKSPSGLPCIRLVKCGDDLAVSALQKANEEREGNLEYRKFKRGQTTLAFPLNFPRGYGAQNKVKAWMEEFQKLPYVSPYQDCSGIDPKSELMEKRVVGVLHEFLSLTVHRKTKRNYLRSLREELNLPHKFTRIFTRYPGIFYLSLKCKTTTIALKEGYQRGKLVDPHPLARVRDKYQYVMRTGILYRAKGDIKVSDQGFLPNSNNNMIGANIEQGEDTEEVETGAEESYEENSELEMSSGEECEF